MKTVAVICEYNPFHNGHLHQLALIKERFGEDVRVIALMSGHFVQRGEPSVMSRESRTKVALAAGISLVLEIPLAFATASARDFADGAVRLLSATGVCRDLVCGAENEGSGGTLRRLAGILHEENLDFRTKLAEFLGLGLNFPAARQEAITALYPDEAESFRPFFQEPNNILALEYQMAILRENERLAEAGVKKVLTLHLLPRRGDDRKDVPETAVTTSATALRKILATENTRSGRLKGLEMFLPEQSLAALLTTNLVLADQLTASIVSQLVSRRPEELTPYRYLETGLAERLINTANEVASSGATEDFWASATTRYYPQTRIKRAVLSWLLGMTEADWQQIQAEGPLFIRVCGMDKHGRYLAKLMRKTASLPRIDKNSDLLEALAETKTQQNLALRGEALYRLWAGNTQTIFDSYTEIL